MCQVTNSHGHAEAVILISAKDQNRRAIYVQSGRVGLQHTSVKLAFPSVRALPNPGWEIHP